MRKKELAILLESLLDHPRPTPGLEQYTTPPEIAADILHIAHINGHIEGRSVLDLGSGVGTFAIGSALLGASISVGVEVDEVALHTALINLERVGGAERVMFILGDAREVQLPPFSTALMNPPFGAQRRGADRPFLQRASELSDVIYTLVNAPSRGFALSFMEERGFSLVGEKKYIMPLKYRFRFHRREKVELESLLLIFERR